MKPSHFLSSNASITADRLELCINAMQIEHAAASFMMGGGDL
jgi:hypothetical protein